MQNFIEFILILVNNIPVQFLALFAILYTIFSVYFISRFIYLKRHHGMSYEQTIADVIYEISGMGVIVIDSSQTIVSINKKAEKIMQLESKVFIEKNINLLIPQMNFQEKINKKHIDIHIPDKAIQKILISVTPFKDMENKFIGANIFIFENTGSYNDPSNDLKKEFEKLNEEENNQEITIQNLETEKMEIRRKINDSTRHLSEEHRRLHASLNNLSAGFIMTDKEKNIIMMNNKMKEFLGILDTDIQINIQDVNAHLPVKIELLEKISGSLIDKTEFELKNIKLDKNYTDIFISPIIVINNNIQEVIGVVILFADKTEERLIERSKENFFTIASHELRTPLTGIKGYISIIRMFHYESIQNEELKKIINDIDISSSRLINIVNDFLDSTKFDADKIPVRPQQCDLVQIINSSIKETNSLTAQKKLTLSFNNSIPQAIVYGDKDKIKQIIINLISNGVKYTEHGEITLTLEATPDEKFKLTVKDTGNGIPQANIKFLFTKFQGTDQVKNPNVISTGLGLYIAKLLTEKMGGTIQLDHTEEGKGSTFSFSLPKYHENVAIAGAAGVH